MAANIFISTSFPARGDPDFPEIHGNTAAALIRAIAGCARDFNQQLIVREDPAATPMLEAIMENTPDQLTVLPADTPITDIKTRFNLAAAFFLSGGRDVTADYDVLAAVNRKTILAPLSGGGGAAEWLSNTHRHSGDPDLLGFSDVYRVLYAIRGPQA